MTRIAFFSDLFDRLEKREVGSGGKLLGLPVD